jgi:hypothetical protein
MTERMSAKDYQAYVAKQEAARNNTKYGGIPTTANDGRKFDSHVEAAFYNDCRIKLQAGHIKKIETHVRYEFMVNDIFVGSYELDFRITYPDDRIEYIDTKSKTTLTPLYRIKKQLMLACHGIELKEVYWEDFGRK